MVPEPFSMTVCTACGLPWGDHLAVVEAERYADIPTGVVLPGDDQDSPWRIPVTNAEVHLGVCVELLKQAQRGPQGERTTTTRPRSGASRRPGPPWR